MKRPSTLYRRFRCIPRIATCRSPINHCIPTTMALPLAIPDSPSVGNSPAAGNSPSSTETSNGPRTPIEPDNSVQTLALPPPADGAAPAPSTSSTSTAQPKRKPSRRANTAERRATHNAVERARRETLNGRFLVSPLFSPPQPSLLTPVLPFPAGSCGPPPQPLPDPPSLQVLHRQLLHRPHTRLSQAPPPRRS